MTTAGLWKSAFFIAGRFASQQPYSEGIVLLDAFGTALIPQQRDSLLVDQHLNNRSGKEMAMLAGPASDQITVNHDIFVNIDSSVVF